MLVDLEFLYNLAERANALLEERRQQQLQGKYVSLVPAQPVRMCLAEVEAVLNALHILGFYTPPNQRLHLTWLSRAKAKVARALKRLASKGETTQSPGR